MTAEDTTLENYFAVFAINIIGNHQQFDSPFGQKANQTEIGRAHV